MVLVENHQMVRVGLKEMLAEYPTIRVVGEAEDAPEALRIAESLAPDVVLSEVRLGSTSGLELCHDLLTWCADARVIMLTVHDDEQYLSQAMHAGARGYLLKHISGEELVAAIHRVHAGELVVTTTAGHEASTVTRIESGEYWPGGRFGLTLRESEVLSLIVIGMNNHAIAGHLIVGEETVRTHVRAIYRKLEVNDRTSALAKALREGLFQ
ncbi:response regulator transcription factor [Actinomycetospora chibensis]|uniref:response regulator n=1 Tax=Actinomycetospora chibensis TaxID=663606 RepID=UPI0023669DB4|nr:response regulator transcription factor [Actinomycetospora chibensis]MDD7926536.1 response regulator transcription factor [Actinomycetospora chibensis]